MKFPWLLSSSRVIVVGESALVDHFAHGDCLSTVPKGTVDCTCVTHGQQTFDFTGTEQTFVVPDGVTQVTVDAWGAQGGVQVIVIV